MSDTRLTLRVDFGSRRSIGPGKIRLLEEVARTGSISEAGRKLGMSYRRAWLLTDELNQLFGVALVEAQHGGAKGGGARVTEQGLETLEAYRRVEAAAEAALPRAVIFTYSHFGDDVDSSVSTIDQLIPANDTGQVLGIFTSAGNVNLNNKQSNGNLEIDASIATISQTGSGGIVNTGASINTLTIVGGRIQNTIQNIGATTRNVLFDRRFQNGFAPPWFPSTTITPTGSTGAAAITTWKGTQWLNQTNYQ